MVMEAATLTSPQRKFSVVPVQKSLSLPSYARAGGGGIDHRLIFAALEQKEKGRRRKSSIFTREKKSTRQNIFCLPIPSSRRDKCRETSFSSDTSCSSLEYQKPKKADPKTTNESANLNETPVVIQPEETVVRVAYCEVRSSLACSQSPADTVARLNVCSSDSMERSSRSSTDSFSRKERLVAIKARVEAAREKYGESSSEEESRSSMTRYNSDGSIHRSVRELKSRSSRLDRRLRRRSQGEWSNQPNYNHSKSCNGKKNLSVNQEEGGVELNLKRPSRIDIDADHLDIKTDFCPSPNFPDLIKKNYFSDFPSRENSARFVQARIRHIEDEERKRRSGSDFREKIRTPSRQSPQSIGNTSPASMERRHPFDKQNGSANCAFEKNTSGLDSARCSPLPRSSQAPTPPPRSPKSITFVNKAFLQHQNASLRKKESSLDWDKCSRPTVASTEKLEQFISKSGVASNDGKYLAGSTNNSLEKLKNRELMSQRRKTCGNFDFIDKHILDDLCAIKNPVDSSNSIVSANKKFSSVMQIKGTDSASYLSNTETPPAPLENDMKSKLWKCKWQENEQRREYMFNSLESKKSNPPSWKSPQTDTCLCRLFPDYKLTCICQNELKEKSISADMTFNNKKISGETNTENISSSKSTPNRLSQSEVNITCRQYDWSPSSGPNTKPFALTKAPSELNDFNNCFSDKFSASANLESAMEELENVYRSLKISSDNLSDRNSVSNVSLSDDGCKASKSKTNDCAGQVHPNFKRRLSVFEGNYKSDMHGSLGCTDPDRDSFNKSNALTSPSYPTSNNKKAGANNISIDELFNNMTLQLDDLEQNFLKGSTQHASQQSKYTYEKSSLNNEFNCNQPPHISIRKQFYDNLSKNTDNQNKCNYTVTHSNKDTSSGCLDKKKYKAVRSLSQNISNLMASPNSIRNNSASQTSLTDQSERSLNQRKDFDSPITSPKKDSVFNQSNIFNDSNRNTTRDNKRDEIRHIRVSMDSDLTHSKNSATVSSQQSRLYPRLSSAVSSSKSEMSLTNAAQEKTLQLGLKQECGPRPSSSSISPVSSKNDLCLKSTEKDDTLQLEPIQKYRPYPRLSSSASSSKSEVHLVKYGQEAMSESDPLQECKSYPRLNSPVSSSKTEVSLENSIQKSTNPFEECKTYLRSNASLTTATCLEEPAQNVDPNCLPKDGVDVDDLEKLLNSLLGDVPEKQQSSLLHGPTTPPPPVSSGKYENVKSNRAFFPLKMDIYVPSNQKKASTAECSLKNVKPEENAQKGNSFGPNNNGTVSQVSFIPVYTKKTDVYHNFSRNIKDDKSQFKRVDSPEPTQTSSFLHSPPLRQKALPGQNEKSPVKTWSMHMRRRSVGFEDMTSAASRYGYNLTNEQRLETRNMNCNVEAESSIFPKNNKNSENDRSLAIKTKIEGETGCIGRINQNTQLSENDNNHIPRSCKPAQYLKDKSSKRKSSLNRIDFIDCPTSAGNIQNEIASQPRNSSSDEENYSNSHHPKYEFLPVNSKRKNFCSTSSSLPKTTDRKTNEVPLIKSPVAKDRSHLLPRSLQKNQTRLRQHRRVHSTNSLLQKLSHSAGELESLTDPSEAAGTSHKICLSAQEFDTPEASLKNLKITKKSSRLYLPTKSPSHMASSYSKNSNNSSQSFLNNDTTCSPASTTSSKPEKEEFDNSNPQPEKDSCVASGECTASDKAQCDADPVLRNLELNGTLDLKHIDSRSEEDLEMSISKMGSLDITQDNEIYMSCEENADLSGSEAERWRGSILRKKSSEEKRELHGILKPPSEDNPTWTPPSILKHRESSEEKESWLSGDLHSILKKSTSEEESCNSGSDIRPILKVSTDEDSPGGGNSSSTRPRPILKKRTSFSEECYYARYPNGELKPILKKKIALLPFDEQPRPILKSRRKSEDTKSFSEFVASRPRAYSADMGVRTSARLEGLELSTEDPGKSGDHDS